ncbi:stage III sporulation protein AA [Clostridium sp. AM58-1XD]|uniref:stage III sporulation protein AA n=1 Tax=Clostridium sp. AM58-1XD TaxID=2292307 RepID=UPI000E4B349A|nr:stage III sporulation protein AA [Clostridium sp. AM58-1XD]RGY99102.1 stage III sporulation protein AA [Clostridium sp. AM58-1XD]
MENRDGFLQIFSKGIREMLAGLAVDFGQVQEIRLRISAPLFMVYQNREVFISKTGRMSAGKEGAYIVTRKDLKETVECMSNYSMYAFEEELRQGFITIQGGHRIGIAGRAVADGRNIRTMKFISFINVRLSHEVKGCADRIMPFLMRRTASGNEEFCHTLIVSPPRCGKTTLLRDIIRQVSNGTGIRKGMTAGVVDERSEIAACWQGEPQNDVGIRTDVLDCCPKAAGMMMMIRSMSPEVIAVDEIGSREELEAVRYAVNCGCRLVATVHGESIEDIKKKPVLNEMFAEGIFQRYVLLDCSGHIGHVAGVYDAAGKNVGKETGDQYADGLD